MKFRWPWHMGDNLERRADSSYTDALVQAITANAGGQTTAFPDGNGRAGGLRRDWSAGHLRRPILPDRTASSVS